MPSLRCLTSALTQAGRGDLLFRFASSVQSCCGEGGALQADVAVCGEHSPCSGHTGFAPRRGVCAFPVYTAQAPGCSIWSGPWVECSSSFQTKERIRLRLRFVPDPASAVQAARGLGARSPRVRRAFSFCCPGARRQSGLRKSLDRTRGPVCSVGGGGFSGAEFAPFPSPLPPSSSGDGPALLWSFSVPLFCEPLAVC